MGKLPFMQFYPADWIQDTQTLDQSAKGSWIDLLCQMWLAPERGVLDWCLDEFTTLLRLNNDSDTEQTVAHLERVADITLFDAQRNQVENVEEATHIKLINRRMVRDEEKRKAKQLADLKYNEKRTKSKRSQNDHKTSPIYQKSEVISHIKKPPISPKGDVVDLAFQRFWDAYPKKAAKRAAKKAWGKEAAYFTDIQEKLMVALARAKNQEQWLKDSGQFIPLPATWLNGRRWEDEITEQDDIFSKPHRTPEQILAEKGKHAF